MIQQKIKKIFTSQNNNVIFATLFLLGFFLYSYILTHGNYFFYDSKATIQLNPDIRDLTNLKQIWEAFNTRFIVGLSFAMNYSVNGLNPLGYRLINIIIHVCTSFLVFMLTYLTLNIASPDKPSKKHPVKLIALIAALLFLAHPIQTESINYLSQRFVLLASFFYLLAIIFYIKGRLGGRRRALFLVSSFLATILAMFCKEFTITLPLMLLLYECFFFSSRHEKSSKRFLTIFPFLCLTIIIPITLLYNTSQENIGTARIADIQYSYGANQSKAEKKIDITRAGNTSLDRKTYFMTELSVIRTYFRLFLFPINQNVDYDYSISRRWGQTNTISLVFILSVLTGGLLLYRKCRAFSFFIFWIFLTLSVESSIIPIGHVIAEYRLYLPSVGYCIFTALFLSAVCKKQQTLLIYALILILSYSFLTIKRNFIWSDEVKIWEDAFSKSSKISTYNNLGLAFLEKNKIDKAIPYFKSTINSDPTYDRGYSNLCIAYARKEQLNTALEYCLKSIEISPNNAHYQQWTGFVYAQQKKFEKSLHYYGNRLAIEKTEFAALEYFKIITLFYKKTQNTSKTLEYIALLKEYNFQQMTESVHNLIKQAHLKNDQN